MEPLIEILLSTYNGSKYLKELLDSIKQQRGVSCRMLIRDDGSTDKTKEILESESACDWRVEYGENIGVVQSFFSLIEACGEAEYYAFCDQDDVWLPDKLLCGEEELRKYDPSKPAMYHCDVCTVDEQLNPIHQSKENKKRIGGIPHAMTSNDVVGCTLIINAALMKLLKKYKPYTCLMHDWWVNLVCCCCGGTVIFDSNKNILYRQHGNNVCGESNSFKSRIRKNGMVGSRRNARSEMCLQVALGYNAFLTSEARHIIDLIKVYKQSVFARVKLSMALLPGKMTLSGKTSVIICCLSNKF